MIQNKDLHLMVMDNIYTREKNFPNEDLDHGFFLKGFLDENDFCYKKINDYNSIYYSFFYYKNSIYFSSKIVYTKV